MSVFNDNYDQLQNVWFPKWRQAVRAKIPSDMNVSNDEIDSELADQAICRAKSFKGGDFCRYVNQYIVKDVVRTIWAEYKKLDHDAIAQAYDEFDSEYADSYECRRGHGYADIEETTVIDKKLIDVLTIKEIYTMNKYCKISPILMMVFNGMSFDEIGRVLGISKMEVSRRLRKIGDDYKEFETNLKKEDQNA